jgi:hypothetical protein
MGRKLYLIATILLYGQVCSVSTGYVDKFAVCKRNILGVLNGTYSIGNITNTTILTYDYIYTGPVKELKPDFPRKDYLTLTYPGKISFLELAHISKLVIF